MAADYFRRVAVGMVRPARSPLLLVVSLPHSICICAQPSTETCSSIYPLERNKGCKLKHRSDIRSITAGLRRAVSIINKAMTSKSQLYS